MYFQNESVPIQAERKEGWENGVYQRVAADWGLFSTESGRNPLKWGHYFNELGIMYNSGEKSVASKMMLQIKLWIDFLLQGVIFTVLK